MLELRHRHRLRRKEIVKLGDELEKSFGFRPFNEDDSVDMAEGPKFSVLLLGSFALGAVYDGVPFMSIRGLLKWPATRHFVSVDEGAIKFICNGADVMGPGITEADLSIAVGDIVWVRDRKHGKPLVVGRALVTGAAMATKSPGKAIKNLHYVGDELWNVGVLPVAESPDKKEE